MFSGSIRPDFTSSRAPYDRRLSYSGEQQQSYSFASRPQYEPPRALEPRPTLYSSLSDTTSLQRRQAPYGAVGGVSERRPPGPSLPGLRDILTPAPTGTGSASYGSSWRTPTSVPTQARPEYASSYVHPPMVLEPQTQAPANHRPRSWEVPLHSSGPELSHPPHAIPLSPYANYSQDYGQSPDDRYERNIPRSATAHLVSGVTSPYSGVAPDGSPFGGAVAYERGQPPSTPTASAENQKKYLGIKDVPGEGTYHLYEGGYRIPTHVDGEHVNPAWGLTKANKPRKRLALACLDCREKKIKCEPGASSCLQCEKAKRPCRRTQMQQSQGESVTTADWSPSGPTHSRSKASVSDPTPAPSREGELETQSKRRSRDDPSPPGVPYKKHRSASPLRALIRGASLPMRDGPKGESTTKPLAPAVHGGIISWEDDPYEIEPDVALQLLYLYFAHFNSATYCLYPREHFTRWVTSSRDKCQNERMVLYAILAVATIYADESLSGFGRQCARVALDILPLQVGTVNMCTAQARTLLALYSFARGEHAAAWQHSGAAIRAVQYLRYNTEQACVDDSTSPSQPRREFDLSATQHAECKRRIFWSAFLMDRYCQGIVTVLKPQDVFLRLPCTEDMFERGSPSDAPYLNNGTIDPIQSLLTAGSPLSPMGWHVLVASIWGDVADFIFRAPYHAATSYKTIYESFYAETWNRLQGWLSRLPDYLQNGTTNLHRSMNHGYASTFVSIHALYHLCCMKLNRSLRHTLAQESITRNIRAAHDHGHQMLQLMCAVNAARGETNTPIEGPLSSLMSSTPYVGYATLVAVDIVSAGGTDSAIGATLEEIKGGLVCLRELSRFWNSAKDQAKLCEKRYYQIQNIVTNPGRARGGAWLGRKWGLEKPLEQEASDDCDCIYGLGGTTEAAEVYFDAFGDPSGQSKASTGGLRIA